jgi:hypothetical protein
VSIYDSTFTATAGKPEQGWVYYSGFVVALLRLGIAAIPCGLFGGWGIPMITFCGIVLAFTSEQSAAMGRGKWACRKSADKTVVLTRGNRAQYAIVNGKGLDLEDLAAGLTNVDLSASLFTRIATGLLALLWILLLIQRAGAREGKRSLAH